jgi:hypothetical protein
MLRPVMGVWYAAGAMTRPLGRRPRDAWLATISNRTF